MTTPRFRKFTAADGSHRWTLHAANGEPVCTSEGYTRTNDRDRSIDAVRRMLAVMAIVDDEPPPDDEQADHQAARQEFARRATDRNPDGPDEAA